MPSRARAGNATMSGRAYSCGGGGIRTCHPGGPTQPRALVAHFGGAVGMLVTGGVGGWVAPLIVLLAKGNQSPTVRAHAVNALNFQLLWSIVGVLVWSVSWRLPVLLPLLAVTIIGVGFG